jgi:type IV secretion system protein VirD4
MFAFLRRLLGWANQQPKFLRFLIKYSLLLAGVMAVAFIALPLLGGIVGVMTGGGLGGFFVGLAMTFGGVVGFGLPLLLLIFGLPWLIIAVPAIMLTAAFGPLALLRMVAAQVMPIFAAVKDWHAFQAEMDRMLGQAPDTPRIEHGSARWAEPSELRQDQRTRKADGKPIEPPTMLGAVDSRPFAWMTPKHILLLASSRSGKGRSVIIPNLLTYTGGTFTLDPKGENAQVTARQKRLLNGADRVYVLDPWGISGEPIATYNPFDRLERYPDQIVTEAAALASAIVTGKSDHWNDNAQALLQGLILHVATAESPENRHLPRVRQVLTESLDETLKAMQTNLHAFGLVRRSALSLLAKEEKERSSIISTAATHTAFLDTPQIAASLIPIEGRQNLSMAVLLGDPASIFVSLPAPLFPAYNRWLRLVLTSALNEMTMKLQPPDQRVLFILDELATLGRLDAVENAVGLAAGYGLQVWAIFQDIPQMRAVYESRWASFVGNSGITCVFATNDNETAEYASKMIGVGTIESRSESRDRAAIGQGVNAGVMARPLQTPDEVLRLNRRQMYVLRDGEHPVIVDRVNYDQNPALAGLWGAEPQPMMPQPEPVRQTAPQPQPSKAPISGPTDDDFREVFGKMKAKREHGSTRP